MSCEDCKNYEKDIRKDFQEIGQQAHKILEDYCLSKECNDCAMSIKGSTCIFTKITKLLEEAGWER